MSTVKFHKVPELFPSLKIRTVRTEQLWFVPPTTTKPRRRRNLSVRRDNGVSTEIPTNCYVVIWYRRILCIV